MAVTVLPLLQTQRDLQAIPRGMDRFRAYIATLTGGGDDLALPLTALNPMGKEHVAQHLDALLALGAEAVAAEAIAGSEAQLPPFAQPLQVALVAVDDAAGGWTNRYFSDCALRFDIGYNLEHGWVVVPLWTGEAWGAAEVQVAVRAALFRASFVLRRGLAASLEERMAQEGGAAAFAQQPPLLDDDDIAYSREVIAPHRASTHFPIVFTCLYGDAAAREVGYPPLGLSAWAGYAVAQWEAENAAGLVALPQSHS